MDAALVEAAKAGNPAAYEELVSRYERRIFRLAVHITRHREDAEEVVQDTFLRAYTRLNSFQGDALFSTWLTRIAINQALMMLRKRRGNVLPLDEPVTTEDGDLPHEVSDWGPNPEQQFSQAELGNILDRVIASLDPAYRIVFQLRDVEDLSILETAAALHLSASAVKSRLLRARLELREKLNKYFSFPPALSPSLNALGK